MSNINSATPAMAVVVDGKVRRKNGRPFHLMPVPVDAIPGWNDRVRVWAAALMADTIDDATAMQEAHLSHSLRATRAAAAAVPVGVAGECEQCGDDSPRLVRGRCAPCRDGRRR